MTQRPLDEIMVPTDVAVAFLAREGVTEAQGRSAIRRWAHQGRIKNYGGSKHGQALWNLRELQRAATP